MRNATTTEENAANKKYADQGEIIGSGREIMGSLSTRISATVLVGAFWFAFIVLYLAFYAGNLDFWQRAAVFLASMAIACALIAVFWIRWAIKEP